MLQNGRRYLVNYDNVLVIIRQRNNCFFIRLNRILSCEGFVLLMRAVKFSESILLHQFNVDAYTLIWEKIDDNMEEKSHIMFAETILHEASKVFQAALSSMPQNFRSVE